ncbi:TetR/AcrR family transcriptional regulator [Candidatus Avelusimicrobium aviculae]|uniref:TetR/AcrR family transcriptional regulator n=1 Tax=Candidatus Avelusimicrobium aviculae TaxID=3416206 RepID=UPI003D0BA807
MKQNEHPKTDKQDRERRMRHAIKKAAFFLMAEKGIDQVSMREIAEKVKVTKPVLYYYFKNKEDLCRSIVDEHEERFFAMMEDAYSKGHNLEEVLNLLLQAHMEFFRKSPVNSKFVMQMIAYTLNRKFPAEQRRPLPEVVLGKYLAQKEGVHHLPAGAAQDISRLISALFFKVMLNAYVNTYVHGGAVPATYDEEVISRTVRIILLGVKRYYEDKKK